MEASQAAGGPAPDNISNGPAHRLSGPDCGTRTGVEGCSGHRPAHAVSPWSQVLPLGPIQSHLRVGAAVPAQPGPG